METSEVVLSYHYSSISMLFSLVYTIFFCCLLAVSQYESVLFINIILSFLSNDTKLLTLFAIVCVTSLYFFCMKIHSGPLKGVKHIIWVFHSHQIVIYIYLLCVVVIQIIVV